MRELDRLREDVAALPHVTDEVRARLDKFACGGALKHPKNVSVHWEDNGGASVVCDMGNKTRDSWEVCFEPDGSFRCELQFTGRSDGRIKRCLAALGYIHRKGGRQR